jgi:aspartyl-tRNA(Asn)/glutamyl-tRNA(Gln) amidotransferase subunit A
MNRSLPRVVEALRQREVSAAELVEEAIERHASSGSFYHAYKHWDADGARERARQADARLAADSAPPPFCGIPVSVKDLYGVEGLPTFAGTARRLPNAWEKDAWLVGRLRDQGAVFMGKTHMVELAYGAVGINPHWGTPRNPWDASAHRVPGGSSSGAGVSLWDGSALLALGSDTGGSIRIPASMTGTVGHRITFDRWPVAGVVPLSQSLDTVGGLTRSVEDSVFFFGAVDPAWGDPAAFLRALSQPTPSHIRVAIPRCGIWEECQADISDVVQAALAELASAGWHRSEVDGRLLDEARRLYETGGIAGAECLAFLEKDLPGWLDILHPTVGERLAGSPVFGSEAYARSLEVRRSLMARVDTLFADADVLVLPTVLISPPIVSELDDLDRYVENNGAALAATSPISMLGLCAITIPVGLDRLGMPVGLQFVAPGGQDEALLSAALAAERVLGTARDRLGTPPPR